MAVSHARRRPAGRQRHRNDVAARLDEGLRRILGARHRGEQAEGGECHEGGHFHCDVSGLYRLPRSASWSFNSCSTFSLFVQKFSVRSSLPSEYVRHAEVHVLVSTFGSSSVYWYSR